MPQHWLKKEIDMEQEGHRLNTQQVIEYIDDQEHMEDVHTHTKEMRSNAQHVVVDHLISSSSAITVVTEAML